MKKFALPIIVFAVCVCFFNATTEYVKADDLSETIEEQLGMIDFSDLDEYFNDLTERNDFFTTVYNLLNGNYELNFNSIFDYVISIFFSNLSEVAPTFISIFAIAVFCGLANNVKSSFFSDEIAGVVFFVCFLAILLLFSAQFVVMYNDTGNMIENIGRLNEILSPILLTLMVASGGSASASIYKPVVALLSGGIIHIVLYLVLPLAMLNMVFSIMSGFSESVKLKKFADFFSSVIKWVIGLSVTVFGIFLSVQGIAAAGFDGISIKAAKYAISNSVPIIGGFLKDGFDLVVAGSVLIKNSVGVAAVVSLFYAIVSPVLQIAIFSLMLKLTSALIEPVSDGRISELCSTISKSITYLSVCLLFVAFMFFITILLMIFSANAFI